MISPDTAKVSFDMDDLFSLAIERERHSLLCDACEESEMFVEIERLLRSLPNKRQLAFVGVRPARREAGSQREG